MYSAFGEFVLEFLALIMCLAVIESELMSNEKY
jgi:hypothetical protein